MNFLAHALLSGEDNMILCGNFVGDSVKGNDMQNLPMRMQQGVKLHRFIDHYTDNHPVVEESKFLLRDAFKKYAPVVADVFYDHFLANHWSSFHHEPLDVFINRVYAILNEHQYILPTKTQQYLPYLIKQNWLLSYKSIEGISEVLLRMSKRTPFYSGMHQAQDNLQMNYSRYEEQFLRFFPDLVDVSQKFIKSL